MIKLYHRMMYKLKYNLWYIWHCKFRNWYDDRAGCHISNHHWSHMCCNGNAGGWRTDLCDWLENYSTGYRSHEERM